LGACWSPRRWLTVVAAPTGVFSILGRVQGGRKGNNFAAWLEPNLFTTEVRAAFRSLREQGGRHE
jgi:hypothetical protein